MVLELHPWVVDQWFWAYDVFLLLEANAIFSKKDVYLAKFVMVISWEIGFPHGGHLDALLVHIGDRRWS